MTDTEYAIYARAIRMATSTAELDGLVVLIHREHREDIRTSVLLQRIATRRARLHASA